MASRPPSQSTWAGRPRRHMRKRLPAPSTARPRAANSRMGSKVFNIVWSPWRDREISADPVPSPSPERGEGVFPQQSVRKFVASEVLAQPQRVVDRRMGVALGHAVADAEQQIASSALCKARLRLDREQRFDVDLALVARAFLERVVEAFVRTHAVLHHHLVDHPLFLGPGVFVLQHRHQLVALAVDLFQHQVAGHDHFLGVQAAVVGGEAGAADGHARLDIVGDDLHLGTFLGDEVGHRHTGELADGVVYQHVVARRDGAVEDVPAADHQAFGRAPVLVLLDKGVAAVCQDDDVRARVHDAFRVGTGTQAQVDIQARQFQLEPAGDAGHLVALRSLGRQADLPAEAVLLLEQGDVMAALGGDAGRFHPGRTTADDHYLALRPAGFFDDMRQAHIFAAGGRVLDAQYVQPLVLAVDAVVGTDALLDLVDLTHLDLGDQVRVGYMRAGHADHVDIDRKSV